MMLGRMIFAGVVGAIEGAASPKVGKLMLSIATFEQMEALILDALGVMVPMVKPCVVMLSVVTIVRLSCGCPISSSVVQRGTASLQP